MSLHPGLKHPTSQSLRRGWLFGVTYHNMRGAIASATAAWAILLDRCAVVAPIEIRLSFHNHLQSKDLLQRVEVPVVMQQLETPTDARRSYNHVDGFVNGHAFGAKDTIVPCMLSLSLHIMRTRDWPMSCSNTISSCYCQCESNPFRRRGGVPLPYHRPTRISDALVRNTVELPTCSFSENHPRGGVQVLSGRVVF